MRQLNEKERLSSPDGVNNSELAERLRMYDDQLSKFEQLREELSLKDKLITDLQSIVNNSSNRSKPTNTCMESPVKPVSNIVIYFVCSYWLFLFLV